MRRIEISPSILSADFSCLAEQITLVEKAGADSIHLDVMDGHFVPNISFGPPVIRSIRKVTTLPFWSHLMIKNPGNYLQAFKAVGSDGILIHAELEEDLASLAERIHKLEVKAGLVFNPETDVTAFHHVIRRFERILIMTVNPGFGGQEFMPGPLDKIRVLKEQTASWKNPPIIEVDGGVDTQTALQAVEAGADALVIGSAIYSADDPAAVMALIRENVETHVRKK